MKSINKRKIDGTKSNTELQETVTFTMKIYVEKVFDELSQAYIVERNDEFHKVLCSTDLPNYTLVT